MNGMDGMDEIERTEARQHARVFKAFCDETRLAVLGLLRGGEQCACVLEKHVDVSQPTLSHHMKILVGSGVVSARKQGKWTYYAISAEGSARAAEMLTRITTVAPDETVKNEGCCE